MKNFRRFAITTVALALGLPAVAQNADTVATTTTTGRAPTAVPSRTVHNSASSKAVLQAFGPYITQTGVGTGGADVSELYTATGYNIYGWGAQSTIPNVMADDFVVPGGQTWTITNFKWLFYQTGAPTSGTITSADMNVWSSAPVSQGGAQLPGGNVYQSATWTGVYRVLDSDLTAINRALIEVTCDGSFAGSLGAGTYWLEGSAAGSLSSGPWTPPTTLPNMTGTEGCAAGWNAQQAVGAGGAFAAVAHGNGDCADMCFQVEGTGGGGGGFQTFCNSRPSSLPNCTPSLAGPSQVNKSGTPAAPITAGPVPGGTFPSILIYTKNGLTANPINTQFGELCLNQFLRAGNPQFVAFPGGNSGVCDGSYSYDMAAIAAFYNQIAVGDTLYVQAWYRDPANPGTANFTEAGGTITVQ